jgi:hypothetical protein
MEIDKILEKAIKQLKAEKSLPKDAEINEKTILTGSSSLFDSVSFVQFTSYIENEISKKIKKDFFIILNEIPEFKKNSQKLTLGALKKFLKQKI